MDVFPATRAASASKCAPKLSGSARTGSVSDFKRPPKRTGPCSPRKAEIRASTSGPEMLHD